MKLIGITQQLLEVKKFGEIRTNLDIQWYKFLTSINLLPLPLPLDISIDLYQDYNISGLILTGGGELHSQSGNNLSYLRDKLYIKQI